MDSVSKNAKLMRTIIEAFNDNKTMLNSLFTRVCDEQQSTPLHHAADSSYLFKLIVETLKNDPQLLTELLMKKNNNAKKSPLQIVAPSYERLGLILETFKDHSELVEKLLKNISEGGYLKDVARNSDALKFITEMFKDKPEVPLPFAVYSIESLRPIVETLKNDPQRLTELLLIKNENEISPMQILASKKEQLQLILETFKDRSDLVEKLLKDISERLSYRSDVASNPYALKFITNMFKDKPDVLLPLAVYSIESLRPIVETFKSNPQRLTELLLIKNKNKISPMQIVVFSNEQLQLILETFKDHSELVAKLLKDISNSGDLGGVASNTIF
jgi:hypothetical protein